VRRIRSIGTEYAKTVPIVALTANAIIENEAMFLRNGFQAFLSKPIDILRMDAAIRQWVRDKEREKGMKQEELDEKTRASQAGTSSEEPSLAERRQIDGLDLKEGLERFGGREESLLHVLRSYAKNMPALLDRIRAPKEGQLSDYMIVVHGIKGSSYGICARAVGKRAEDLERAAKADDFTQVQAETPGLLEAAEKLVADISAMLEGLGSERRKPSKDAPDEETLDRLKNACAAYRMDEVDEAMTELEKFEYAHGRNLVEWLRARVDAMDFKEIQERLSFAGNTDS
jgi:CheY-like chemotaxis protein